MYEEFRKKLLEAKNVLEKEIKDLETPPNFGDVPGPEDDTDEEVAAINQEAIAHSLKEKLANIESALVKIDKGTYGVCELCGSAIDHSLLLTTPDMRWCLLCNQKSHKHEHR